MLVLLKLRDLWDDVEVVWNVLMVIWNWLRCFLVWVIWLVNIGMFINVGGWMFELGFRIMVMLSCEVIFFVVFSVWLFLLIISSMLLEIMVIEVVVLRLRVVLVRSVVIFVVMLVFWGDFLLVFLD